MKIKIADLLKNSLEQFKGKIVIIETNYRGNPKYRMRVEDFGKTCVGIGGIYNLLERDGEARSFSKKMIPSGFIPLADIISIETTRRKTV